MKSKIKVLLFFWKTLFSDIAYLRTDNKDLIDMDISELRQIGTVSLKGFWGLNQALLNCQQFRNIFYYRIKKQKFVVGISKLFCPPIDTVEISNRSQIGGGFRISHKYCVVSCKSAGRNLVVTQGVTIGKGKQPNDCPIIGDDVYIGVNAVLFGNIRIGNNVKIGAGAVVLHDVPDNCTVVGNPARIIMK